MRFSATLAAAFLLLSVTFGCSGGGGGSTPSAPPAALRDIAILAGTWRQGLCVPQNGGATSARQQFDVTRTGDLTITYTMGFATFPSGNCTGSVVDPPIKSPMGTVQFSPTEISGDVTFNRGTWTLPSGTVTKVIWALRNERTLYTFTDSGMPTPDQVAAYVRVLAADQGLVKP